MRILACLGISNAAGWAFSNTISGNAEVFNHYGIQFASGVSIMKGIATGDRMRENRVSQLSELSSERRNLDVMVLRNPNFFCDPDRMLEPDGTLLPTAELIAGYLNHALSEFDLDVLLSIEPFPNYAIKNKKLTFRQTMDGLSRSELIHLSWREQIIRICQALPNARISLVSDHSIPGIFAPLLQAFLPRFPETELIQSTDAFQASVGSNLRIAEDILDLVESREEPDEKARHFMQIFATGDAGPTHDAIATELGLHKSIIVDLIESYFADIEYLSNIEIENLDTSFLG